MVKSNGAFRVEHGVALPKRSGARSRYPFKQMGVGDSFFIAKPRKSEYTNVYGAARAQGVKAAVRKDGGGLRVWRIA